MNMDVHVERGEAQLQKRPDRRSLTAVYILEQMAFIYICENGSSRYDLYRADRCCIRVGLLIRGPEIIL